jgi:hypothetical protein
MPESLVTVARVVGAVLRSSEQSIRGHADDVQTRVRDRGCGKRKEASIAVLSHPRLAPPVLPLQPELRVIEGRQRAAKLHLFSYLAGNALFGRCGRP